MNNKITTAPPCTVQNENEFKPGFKPINKCDRNPKIQRVGGVELRHNRNKLKV